ncbi:MAG TPA: alpha/beta hydrolase [Ktedonobacterales bacterium]|nr:alpha/beta hydrolase [Ktedonobacterales bacterium]
MPLVYCHGMPGSRLDQIMEIAELQARRIRLIVPDRPGYGLSTIQKYALIDWPNDLTELMVSLQIDTFAIFGISGGGAYAAACAYRFPERVTRLGLVSSGAPDSDLEFEYRGINIGRFRRRLMTLTSWPVYRLFGTISGRINFAYATVVIDFLHEFPDWDSGKHPRRPRQEP